MRTFIFILAAIMPLMGMIQSCDSRRENRADRIMADAETNECRNALIDEGNPVMATGTASGSYTVVLNAIDGSQFTGFFTLL